MVEEPKTNNSSSDIRQETMENITTLISLSLTIHVFSVRWQLIRSSLDKLYSGLLAFQSTRHDQTMADLVSLVYTAVNECHELGLMCVSVSYGGKLLMQSNLDKVISKLDLVVRRLESMYRTEGVLSDGLVVVVVKPAVGATREDMKFYVMDLLNRVKIGDCEVKNRALVSINEALAEDDKYVKIVVELDYSVLMISSCLDSSDSSIQEEAAVAIAVVSGFDCYRGVLVVAGLVAQLVRVLVSGSAKARKYSVLSLMRLTKNGDNAWAFSAHGGVTTLLNICSRDDDDDEHELIGLSCWVLRNVIVVDEIKRFMIEEGAIVTFISLIESRHELVQIGSIECLQSFVIGDELVRKLVIKEGGVRGLVRVLDPKLNTSFKLRETASRAIENLCFNSVDGVNLLISSKFLDQLLYFLQKGDISIQELAFKLASKLCTTSEDARKSMGDLEFMSEFVIFLQSKSFDLREMAAEALYSMITIPKNRKKFSNDDHNIVIVLQMIDPKDSNSAKSKLLLSILLAINNCNHARRVISQSEYVKNVQKLAEVGVSDAKKLMRKLSSNRFKIILNGICIRREKGVGCT